jgi:ribosomal protein S18 acetylase RimI-like enzyme
VTAQFVIEPMAKTHDRSGFRCGNDRIDQYFRETVSQDIKRDYATCFIARDVATNRIAGFYTLSASNVPLVDIPPKLARRLPRYPSVSAVLIGWLARHLDFAGAGVGELLLVDAIRTIVMAPIGAHAVFADAIDERAAAFYASFGFTPLISRPETLYLPLANVGALFSP